jgi:anti-sigma regulatory factor (Ser/Thr protein kinase)
MPETLVVRAEIAEMARVWDWANLLGQRLALSQSTLFAIHLCFEEALSNIVQYGFASDRDESGNSRDVHLTLERVDDTIIVTIKDYGVAFDPFEVAAPDAPATISEAPIGGRGIHLMRQFSRHIAYERRDGVNHLTLSFAYP